LSRYSLKKIYLSKEGEKKTRISDSVLFENILIKYNTFDFHTKFKSIFKIFKKFIDKNIKILNVVKINLFNDNFKVIDKAFTFFKRFFNCLSI